MKVRSISSLARLAIALTGAGMLLGCGSPRGDAYFTETRSKANVFVSRGHTAAGIRKVAIMPFKAATELIGTSVSDMFITEVLRTGHYELVERSQLKNVLGEAELALSGLSASKAAEVGNMLGADGVIIGTVDEYGKTAERGSALPVIGITIRMVDCKSGQVVWTASDAGKARSRDMTLPEFARATVHGIMAAVYNELRNPKNR